MSVRNATPTQPCENSVQHGPHEWPLNDALRRLCPGLVRDDDMPAEPDEGSAVRDFEGDVWVRIGGHWFAPGRPRPWAWRHLVMVYGPLRLLIDGPMIT